LNLRICESHTPSVEIIRTIAWMKEYARGARGEGRVIGLVPTMGALHEGHTALVARAREECSRVIASVFVNPKQFGPKEDYKKYPRDLEKDAEKLASAGVDAVFAPDVADVYPDGFRTYVNVEGISERLEGRSRPGHFRGVATVVLKLFETVQPHFAYFGRKDAQQVRIISEMAHDLNLDAEIVVCPIVREADGLALSSRNAYLSAEERRAATVLHRALVAARTELSAGVRDALQLQGVMRRIIETERLATADYVEIVSADTFESVVRVARPSYAVLAVFIGKTRLIDNLLVEPASEGSEDFIFHL
jgi:pantoate--beta-alanine ligase